MISFLMCQCLEVITKLHVFDDDAAGSSIRTEDGMAKRCNVCHLLCKPTL
jgi:hypothetical protein